MSRLTIRDDIGRARPTEELQGHYISQLLEKLAWYEDLKDKGLLLKLPCKIGDTIYKIKWKQRTDSDGVTWDILDYNKATVEPMKFAMCHFDSIGKLYFATEEEAEEKLKNNQ